MDRNRGGVAAVGGCGKLVQATLTRPSDTTAYAADDAVSNSTSAPTALTFSDCGRIAAGTGYIVSATLSVSVAAATAGQFELWLFRGTAAPTATNDNSAFAPSDENVLNCIGVISFTTVHKGANNAVYNAEDFSPLFFECGAAVDDLYGLVVVRNAYTPTSAEVFTFTLGVLQD